MAHEEQDHSYSSSLPCRCSLAFTAWAFVAPGRVRKERDILSLAFPAFLPDFLPLSSNDLGWLSLLIPIEFILRHLKNSMLLVGYFHGSIWV